MDIGPRRLEKSAWDQPHPTNHIPEEARAKCNDREVTVMEMKCVIINKNMNNMCCVWCVGGSHSSLLPHMLYPCWLPRHPLMLSDCDGRPQAKCLESPSTASDQSHQTPLQPGQTGAALFYTLGQRLKLG